MLTEVEKGYLLVEAGYRCEYCKQQLLASLYEIDHMWPLSRGGLTIYQNLAVSCARCNRNKGNHTEWIDLLTGATYLLFNPRVMKWSDHFRKIGNEIRGKTSVGRATSALLFRNTAQFLPPDLQWEKIGRLYENQPIYYFLNHLRYRRVRNDFQVLFSQLTSPFPTVELSRNQLAVVEYARDLLLLELFFTRSKLEDVQKGINLCRSLTKKYRGDQARRNEIQGGLSVLLQQRATIKYQAGDLKGAIADQKRAYQIFVMSHTVDADVTSILGDPQKTYAFLRSVTLKSKYQPVDFSQREIRDIQTCIPQLDDWYASSLYAYLADLVLSMPVLKPRIGETLYETITDNLSTEGYGTDTDYARTIPLRRRWWVMHLLYGPEFWQDTLISDLKLWGKVSMFNEVRELQSYIRRTSHLLDKKVFNDAQQILSQG